MDLLDRKVVVVTGGGQGIGRGIVRYFAKNGAKILIAELNDVYGQEAAEEANAISAGCAQFLRTDVGDKQQVERAVATAVSKFGGLDSVINNASIPTPNAYLEDKSDELLEQVLKGGLWGAWWFMRAALPHLQARGGGSFVNFYSIDAEAAAWLHSDYNITKSAIQGLSRSAAVEWARFNIRTNLIAPAAIGTVFEQRARDNSAYRERANSMNPLGRVGDPETDIAPVVMFLVSDLARYVNGETIHVDGGLHLPRFHSRPAELG